MRRSALTSSRTRASKGGLVELAEGKGHEELLDVELRVLLLEDPQALDEAFLKYLAELLRGEVVGQDPAVHRPAAWGAEIGSIHELAWNPLVDGAQRGAAAPPPNTLGRTAGARKFRFLVRRDLSLEAELGRLERTEHEFVDAAEKSSALTRAIGCQFDPE